jgi:hypothetical protein
MDLEGHLWEGVRAALSGIERGVGRDVYVVSFLVYDEEDDPRLPTIMVGYNDEARVRETTAEAYDEHEARWNYAFWNQNQLALLADSEQDPTGAALRAAWIERLGLAYTDADEAAQPRRADACAGSITEAFVGLAIDTVKRAHSSGLIEQTFGRPIPVLIHELEYYDEIAEQNRKANPPGLTAAFTRWIESF